MRRILFGIGAFFICGCVYASPGQVGLINLDAFSWSVDNENITINSASAFVSGNPTYPNSSICQDGVGVAQCGVLLLVDNVYQYMLGSGSGDSFTASMAVNTINSFNNTKIPLSSLGLPDGYKATMACLYRYRKVQGMDGHDLMDGVCNGAPLPPVPQPVKCNVAISNNTIDFGEIAASKFSAAGAGNTPEGTRSQTRDVNIKCDSGSDAGNLKLLLKTSKTEGNYIQSSNQDIGFSVKDSTGAIIVPNSTGQGISVSMEGSNTAMVKISAIPVSISGAKPATGIFTATATLEIESE